MKSQKLLGSLCCGLLLTTAALAGEAPQASGPLVPCLAADAEGRPIWPTQVFPASHKEMAVAFFLEPGQQVRTLRSRWIAVDVGDAAEPNSLIIEHNMELGAARLGLLRYSQDGPLPVGTYRLEVLTDGAPWKTVDLKVVPGNEPVKLDKPSDLLPLEPGKAWYYDLEIRPGKGAKISIPGVEPGPDGVLRVAQTLRVGEATPSGTPVAFQINGAPSAEMVFRLDEAGLSMVERTLPGSETQKYEPPLRLLPLPLGSGVSQWAVGETRVKMWGPLTMERSGGAAPDIAAPAPTRGYLIVSTRDSSHGQSDGSSAAGQETTEWYVAPGVGLVKQVTTSTIAGKLVSRQTATLGLPPPFAIVANPERKGRLGRMVFVFPKNTSVSNTTFKVYKSANGTPADAAQAPVAEGYGNRSFDLMPGKYDVEIAGKRLIGGEVKSRHDTLPRVGVLRVHAENSTTYRLLDADAKTELMDGYGTKDFGLPVGVYYLQIAGQAEQVTVEDGQITEF